MPRNEPIRKLTEIQIGYQFRSKPEGNEHGGVQLIQIKDILPDRSGLSPAGALRFNPERDPSRQLLQEGDVLFMGKGSAPFACAVHALSGPTVAGGMFFILRPDTNHVLPDYLAWLLNNKQTKQRLMIASGTGVAMPVIRRTELEKVQVPLPPLEVQKKISELLELEAQEQNLMTELAEQKRLLTEAVCQKLTEEF